MIAVGRTVIPTHTMTGGGGFKPLKMNIEHAKTKFQYYFQNFELVWSRFCFFKLRSISIFEKKTISILMWIFCD